MCAQDESPLYHSKEIYNKIAIKRPLTNKANENNKNKCYTKLNGQKKKVIKWGFVYV